MKEREIYKMFRKCSIIATNKVKRCDENS